MGVNYNDIISSCKHIDDMMYAQWKYDFEALENLLDNDPRNDGKSPLSFDIWGADPITNFQCLRDIVEFIEEYCQSRMRKFTISSSTNGLPLLREEIVDFIRQHKIKLQLSHDGLGQNVRTKDVDPLDFPIVRDLIKEGTLNAINCTLSNYNWSIFGNIDYFNSKLKEIFPAIWSDTEMATEKESKIYQSLYIKLNHIMDGEYEYNKRIEQLYGDGDVTFHGRNLDNYLEEWDIYFEMVRNHKHNTLKFLPFNKYLESQLRRGNNISDKYCNPCRQFQMGITNNSEHIDSTGRYCDCNLQDADSPVPNRKNELPDYCKGCRFEHSSECNMCGAVPKKKDKCEYFYRWNQFLNKTRNTLRSKKNGGNEHNCAQGR